MIAVYENYSEYSSLVYEIEKDYFVDDCVMEIEDNKITVALKTKAVFLKSDCDKLEGRVYVLACAYFGEEYEITVTRDAYTYYRIKNRK